MIVRELVTKLGFQTDKASMSRAEASVNAMKTGMLKAGAAVVGAFGGFQLGKAILSTTAEMESLNAQFTVMLGSAELAKQHLDELNKFAVETPYDVTDLASASAMMQNFGISAKNVMPYLKMLGDVAGTDKERFKSLTLAFSQIQSSGQLMGQDLLQLINAGFNPLQEISKTTGKSMKELKDVMSKGGISAQMVTDAFMQATSAGGKFAGNLKAQSTTLNGLWSTFLGGLSELGRIIGEAAGPALKDFLQTAIDFMKGPGADMVRGFVNGIRWAVGMIGTLFSKVRAVVAPILDSVRGTFAKFWASVVAQAKWWYSMAVGFVSRFWAMTKPYLANIAAAFGRMFETAIGAVQRIWKALRPVIAAVLDALLGIWEKLLPGLQALWEILTAIQEGIWRLGAAIVEALGPVAILAIQGIAEALKVVAEFISTILEGIRDIINELKGVGGPAAQLMKKVGTQRMGGAVKAQLLKTGVLTEEELLGIAPRVSTAKQAKLLSMYRGGANKEQLRAELADELAAWRLELQNRAMLETKIQNVNVQNQITVDAPQPKPGETTLTPEGVGDAAKEAVTSIFGLELKRLLIASM